MPLRRSDAPVGPEDPNEYAVVSNENVIDAVLVDDKCLMLLDSSPAQLNVSLNTRIDRAILHVSHVEMNWKLGKSEAHKFHDNRELYFY